jgi:hypothetical protein
MASDRFSPGSEDPHDTHVDQARDDALDDALEEALAQNDFISVSRIAFEQSIHFHRLEQYFVALEYSDIALAAWRAYFDGASDEARTRARSTELRMVNVAATQNFNQGDYLATIDLIQRARRLAALLPPTLLTASTEWTTALLERWRRNFPTALQHGLRVWSLYHTHHASPLNVARIHLFIAQLADDCAASAAARGETQLVDRYLQLAHKHLHMSHPPADSRHTPAAEGNYRLIYATHSRLTGRNEDRVRMLESIVPLALAVHDPILEGQVYYALGDEYSFHGWSERARNLYQRAYERLLASQSPSFAVWPLRPLKQEWEFGLDWAYSDLF